MYSMNGSAGRIMSYVCVIVWLNTQQMTNSTTRVISLSISLSNHTIHRFELLLLLYFMSMSDFFSLYLL